MLSLLSLCEKPKANRLVFSSSLCRLSLVWEVSKDHQVSDFIQFYLPLAEPRSEKSGRRVSFALCFWGIKELIGFFVGLLWFGIGRLKGLESGKCSLKLLGKFQWQVSSLHQDTYIRLKMNKKLGYQNEQHSMPWMICSSGRSLVLSSEALEFANVEIHREILRIHCEKGAFQEELQDFTFLQKCSWNA